MKLLLALVALVGVSLSPVASATAATARPLAGRTVVIDPGHDGGNAAHPAQINALVPAGGFSKACDTAGTSTDAGYPEHAFTYDVSLRLAKLLRARGARVVLTRTTDTGVGPCVDVRGVSGQRNHADLAISIHADGGPAGGRGFHVISPLPLTFPGGSTNRIVAASRALAVAVRNHLDGSGLPRSTYAGVDGLIERSDLAGLNLSTVPKVLVEIGNMRNARDAALQTSATFRQLVAQRLADALAARL